MVTPFYRFTIRFLAAILLGLALLALPPQWPLTVLVPRCMGPWQLGKLAFWPLFLESFPFSRWEKRPWLRECPAIVLTTLVLSGSCKIVLALGDNGRLCLALWIALLAAGLAAPPEPGRYPRLWAVLTAVLAIGYGTALL